MPTASLEDVTWNLEHLVDDEGAAGVERLLDEAAALGKEFAAQHAGRVADLDGPGLVAAMDRLAEIHDLAGRAGNYAALRFSADTSDPANGALLQKAEERGTSIETDLLFFDLEWAALDDARADALLETDGLDNYRHHLHRLAHRISRSPVRLRPGSCAVSRRRKRQASVRRAKRTALLRSPSLKVLRLWPDRVAV